MKLNIMKKAIITLLSFNLFFQATFAQTNLKPTRKNPSAIAPFTNRAFLPLMKKINEAMKAENIENKVPVKYPILIYQLGWDNTKNTWGDTLQKFNIVWKPDGTLASVLFHYNVQLPDSENIFYFSDFVRTKTFLYPIDNNGMSDYYNTVSNRIEQNNLQFNFIPRSVTIWTKTGSKELLSSKYLFTTNSDGNITSEIIQYPDNSNNFVDGALYKYIYDSLGSLNYIKYYGADNKGKWFLNDSFSYVKTYDLHGHVNQVTYSDIEGTDTVAMIR